LEPAVEAQSAGSVNQHEQKAPRKPA